MRTFQQQRSLLAVPGQAGGEERPKGGSPESGADQVRSPLRKRPYAEAARGPLGQLAASGFVFIRRCGVDRPLGKALRITDHIR
jgi:hypothetical protein